MPDEETTTSETTEESTEQQQETSGEETAVVEKAENPDAVRKLIDRERDARKAADKKAEELAAKVKEYEDAQKSEQEKLADERDSLRTEAQRAQAESLRLRVALAKKLPEELIDRLRGETQEELEADADTLLSLVKPATASDLDAGAREAAPAQVEPGLPRLAHAYAQSK